MIVKRETRIGWRLSRIAVSALLIGCGSETNAAATCGEGTELKDGVCMIVDSGFTSQETGVDAASDVVMDSSADAESAVDSSGDSPETPLALPDDPCGAYADNFNCSDSCGTTSPECAKAVCVDTRSQPALTALVLQDHAVLHWDDPTQIYTVRTPSHPGVNTSCTNLCALAGNGGHETYAIYVDPPADTLGQGGYAKIWVAAPWYVRQYWPTCAPSLSSCISTDIDAHGYVVIVTNDPNAPAREVSFTFTKTKQVCP